MSELSNFFTKCDRRGYRLLLGPQNSGSPNARKGYYCVYFSDDGDQRDDEDNFLIKCLQATAGINIELKNCPHGPKTHSGRLHSFQNQKALVNHYLDFHPEKLYKFLWYVARNYHDLTMKEWASRILLLWRESEQEHSQRNLINQMNDQDFQLLRSQINSQTSSETVTIRIEPPAENIPSDIDSDVDEDVDEGGGYEDEPNSNSSSRYYADDYFDRNESYNDHPGRRRSPNEAQYRDHEPDYPMPGPSGFQRNSGHNRSHGYSSSQRRHGSSRLQPDERHFQRQPGPSFHQRNSHRSAPYRH